MSKTNLLINDDIWRVLPEFVKSAKHTEAAIAYFGQDGAKLFPLKNGDRLVVDMSSATVKAGSTNPYEIEKLIKRGVAVFTRPNLHAKIVIADKKVLAGSANISKRSRDLLDEVAILTNDSITLKRAKEFLDRICIEPVLPEYLNECKNIYKPPRFTGKKSSANKATHRATHAKLWLVNLVDYLSIPDDEVEVFEQSEDKARQLIKDTKKSELETFHMSYKPKMADEIETGDWVIQCVTHKNKSITVYPPARLITVDHYTRNQKGKERYLFHLESSKREKNLSWNKFQKLLSSILRKEINKPRMMAIRETQNADELLRLWILKRKVSRKKTPA